MDSRDFPDLNKKEDEKDGLDKLATNLYSRRDYFADEQKRRGTFRQHEVDVPKGWNDESSMNRSGQFSNPSVRMSFLRKILFISVAFFLVSVASAIYIFFGGANDISSKNVDIVINGPVSAPGGDVISFEVVVKNQNNADLELADLIIDYPEGTRQAGNTKVSLKRYRESLGAIPKGGSAVKKASAVLFGEESDEKVLAVSVEYRVKGSNAIFSKNKEYRVSVSSAPVTMTVSAVKEINSNQQTEMVVEVVSNSKDTIQNLALSAEYPFGFTFSSADPSPSWSNSFWQLGDLKSGVKRTVKIRGKIIGQDNDDRTFHISVGTISPDNENVIGTNFLTSVKKISIKKPFIGATLALDGDTGQTYIAKLGKIIRADLTLENNAGVKISDLKISAKPTGRIFDPSTVSALGGFFRSSDQTIVWDQTLKPELEVLNPDGTITVSFSFGILPDSSVRNLQNPEMDISVNISGRRQDEQGVSQEVSTAFAKKIRVASVLGLSTRAIYFSGPFTNTGPIPPVVNGETSYTIIWSLTNSANDLSNVKVSATLPSYVKWLSATAPSGEKVTYNPIGGQVVWDVGELKAQTGFSQSPREVSFQISFIPSITQVNTTPTLVTEASVTGDDVFAGQSVGVTARLPLTTELTTDISFKQGQGIVTK